MEQSFQESLISQSVTCRKTVLSWAGRVGERDLTPVTTSSPKTPEARVCAMGVGTDSLAQGQVDPDGAGRS